MKQSSYLSSAGSYARIKQEAKMYFRYLLKRQHCSELTAVAKLIHPRKRELSKYPYPFCFSSHRHVGKEPLAAHFSVPFIGIENDSPAKSQMSWEEAWVQRDCLGVLACLSPFACAPSDFLASVLPENLDDSVVEIQDLGVALVAAVVEPNFWPPWVRQRVLHSNRSYHSDITSNRRSNASFSDWPSERKRSRQSSQEKAMEAEGRKPKSANVTSSRSDLPKLGKRKVEGRVGVGAAVSLSSLSFSRRAQLRHVAFSLVTSLSETLQCKTIRFSNSAQQTFYGPPSSPSYALTLPLWLSLCALCIAETDKEAVALACLIGNVFPEAAGCALAAYCSVQTVTRSGTMLHEGRSEQKSETASSSEFSEPRDTEKGTTSTTSSSPGTTEEHWIYLWKKIREECDGTESNSEPLEWISAFEEDVFDCAAVKSWFLSWEVHCSLAVSQTSPELTKTSTSSPTTTLGASFHKVNLNEIARILTRQMRPPKQKKQLERLHPILGSQLCDTTSILRGDSSGSYSSFTPTGVLPSNAFVSFPTAVVSLFGKVLSRMPILSQLEWVTVFPPSFFLFQYGGPENVVLQCYSQICEGLLASAVSSTKDLCAEEGCEARKLQANVGVCCPTLHRESAHFRTAGLPTFSVSVHPSSTSAVVQTRLLQHILFRAAKLSSFRMMAPSLRKGVETGSSLPDSSAFLSSVALSGVSCPEKKENYRSFLGLIEEITALWTLNNAHAMAASLVPLHDSHPLSLQVVMKAKRSAFRTSQTAEFLENILLGVHWLCTGEVVKSSYALLFKKHNECHASLLWRREQEKKVRRAVRAAVRVVTALLSLCANKEGSLPSRRALPVWRVELAASCAIRSHKFELLLSELPHSQLASFFSLLLFYGYMEEAVTLCCCVVRNNQLDLSAYSASLIGSLWLAVTSSLTLPSEVSVRKGCSSVQGKDETPERATKEDVIARLKQFYRQRILVFGDEVSYHICDVKGKSAGVAEIDNKTDIFRSMSLSTNVAKESKNSRFFSDRNFSVYSCSHSYARHSFQTNELQERLTSLVGTPSFFFCPSISSGVTR